MSINYSCKTKAKATLELFNQISSYLFEQEYDELRGRPKAIQTLQEAKRQLAKIIKTKR